MKFSPLTSSGSSQPLRFTNTAMESYGIMRRSRMESTDKVSLRLSDTPRSWLSSNMVCASWRAEAMELRKSVLSAKPCVGSLRSNPAAGASPRSTRTDLESPAGTKVCSDICARRSRSM